MQYSSNMTAILKNNISSNIVLLPGILVKKVVQTRKELKFYYRTSRASTPGGTRPLQYWKLEECPPEYFNWSSND